MRRDTREKESLHITLPAARKVSRPHDCPTSAREVSIYWDSSKNWYAGGVSLRTVRGFES